MANEPTSELSCVEALSRARKILEGLSSRRIDPRTIRTTETEPRAKGGQGTINVGTMIDPGSFYAGRTFFYPSKSPIPSNDELLKMFIERNLAIKKLNWNREDAEASAKFFKSFVNELSIMASLLHPNIVEFVGFVEDMEKGDAWIVTPWEANGNLREFLQTGEWDIPERVSLIGDVVNGVEYLHTRQPPICHGDLKSLNILVNSSYDAVITDFGSARAKQNVDPTNDESAPEPPRDRGKDAIPQDLPPPKIDLNPSTLELTLTTGPGFTLRWTAPEVLNNGVQGLPSDMWAVGWICWEIFTGKIPFEELNAQGVIISHVMKGKLPGIRPEARLSHIRRLCALISDSWISNPIERIDASTFKRKARFLPSTRPSGSTAGGPKVRSAALLRELGTVYRYLGNTVVAESYDQSAVDESIVTKDDEAKADALHGLGETYRVQTRDEEAERVLREAHKMHARIGNDCGSANALLSLGEIYSRVSRNQEAEMTLREAHEIYCRIGNDAGAANALRGLGETYCAQSRHQEAEKAFLEAHEVHCRTGGDVGAANTLQGLGTLYHVQSRHREAEKAWTDAHDMHCHVGNDLGAANALHGLGDTYRVQYRYPDAEASYRQAVVLSDRVGAGQTKAGALLRLGQVYLAECRYSEAEEAATEALATWISIANEGEQAMAWLVLAQIFKSQSKRDEEKEALIQAEALCARVGPDENHAKLLDHLGDIHFEQGTYDEAEDCYRLAQAIFCSKKDICGEATQLYSLGVLYGRQHRLKEAEECFAEARVASARIFDENGEARALDGLATALAAQGRLADAKAASTEAREIYARTGQPMSEMGADTWRNLQALSNQ